MTVEQALSIDFLRADKTTLRKMNKILTRKINRQMIHLAYDDIGQESSALAEVRKRYGANTVKLQKNYTMNQLKSHVGFIQQILKRQDSSVRSYKKYISRVPDWFNESQKAYYSKLTLQEKRYFWKYFDEFKNSADDYYDAKLAVDAIIEIASKNQNHISQFDLKHMKSIFESYADKRKKELEEVDRMNRSFFD